MRVFLVLTAVAEDDGDLLVLSMIGDADKEAPLFQDGVHYRMDGVDTPEGTLTVFTDKRLSLVEEMETIIRVAESIEMFA